METWSSLSPLTKSWPKFGKDKENTNSALWQQNKTKSQCKLGEFKPTFPFYTPSKYLQKFGVLVLTGERKWEHCSDTEVLCVKPATETLAAAVNFYNKIEARIKCQEKIEKLTSVVVSPHPPFVKHLRVRSIETRDWCSYTWNFWDLEW